ncbi:UNVERIFIED_CONTAM: hypothetical protein FKN15_069848 [Acipenser sinensis]
MLRIGAEQTARRSGKISQAGCRKTSVRCLAADTRGSLEYAPANWNYPSQAVKQAQT